MLLGKYASLIVNLTIIVGFLRLVIVIDSVTYYLYLTLIYSSAEAITEAVNRGFPSISSIAATASVKSVVLTLPFSTFTTAFSSACETLITSVTPETLASADCTLATQLPHARPVTAKLISSTTTSAV